MTTLFDSAMRSTFVLLAAAIVCWFLRRRPADLRHWIWKAALVAVAAMPALISIAPGIPAAHIAVNGGSAAAAVQSVRTFPWTFAIWIAGASLVLLRLCAGIARVMWLTSRASYRNGVYYSDRVSTPLTWGRAIVMREWDEIAIRHERAHIERHDWMWQTFSRIVAAVFWFHPLVWVADRALRREAELAVDDRVVESGADPVKYADLLLRSARNASPAVVAMVGSPMLESRVRAILDPARSRARAGRLTRGIIAVAAVAMVLPLSAFQEGKVYKIGDGVTAPRVLTKVDPSYTEEAKNAHIEGTTTLRCVISTDGRAEKIEVFRSLDAGLDAQAMAAVSQWTFTPGEKDGKAVRVLATIEVNFKLK